MSVLKKILAMATKRPKCSELAMSTAVHVLTAGIVCSAGPPEHVQLPYTCTHCTCTVAPNFLAGYFREFHD